MAKKLKKITAASYAVLISAGLVGCAGVSENNSYTADETTVLTGVEIGTIVQQTEAPQEVPIFETEFEITDWTLDEVLEDFEIEGHKIEFPCKVSDFQKWYTVDLDFPIYYDEYDITSVTICRGDEMILSAHLNGKISSEKDILSQEISSLFIYDSDLKMTEFNFYGISDTSSEEQILNILGKPNSSLDASYGMRYIFDSDNGITFALIDNEIILVNIMYDKEA